MSAINWDELEAKYSFKQVENGEYTTQVIKIEVADDPTMSGFSYAINFELKDLNGVKFPYSTAHWLTFKDGKDDWRIHHMKSLLTDMGVDEAKARKKIEECELAGDQNAIANAYRKMFNALAKTTPNAKVRVETQAYKYRDKESGAEELRPNGHRTEFAGESYMPPQTIADLQKRYPNVPVAGEGEKATSEYGLDDAEPVDLAEIAF